MSLERYANLLRDTARGGVYHAPQAARAELLAAAKTSDLSLHSVDLSTVRDKDALLERLAAALEFPDWFGHNWDALADCLGDLSWLRADGHLILLERCDGFRAAHDEDFTTALQVFAAAAEAWREARRTLWVLVVGMRPDGIAILPGAE